MHCFGVIFYDLCTCASFILGHRADSDSVPSSYTHLSTYMGGWSSGWAVHWLSCQGWNQLRLMTLWLGLLPTSLRGTLLAVYFFLMRFCNSDVQGCGFWTEPPLQGDTITSWQTPARVFKSIVCYYGTTTPWKEVNNFKMISLFLIQNFYTCLYPFISLFFSFREIKSTKKISQDKSVYLWR